MIFGFFAHNIFKEAEQVVHLNVAFHSAVVSILSAIFLLLISKPSFNRVSLALPDTFVEHPATLRLFKFLNSECVGLLPSRRVLGGRVLDACGKEYLEQSATVLRKVQDTTGGRVNFLSDVWQNIAKAHLLGVHLTLFGKVYIEGMHRVDSDHHGCAIAHQMEGLIVNLSQKEWVIGYAITDGAGQCGRARRILALRWPNIYFGKCFAHDINNLVKAVLKTPSFCKVADEASSAVNALNASSSKWLPRVDAVIRSTYDIRSKSSLALLTLCDTRWNSMQGCFASLLRVKTALKQFVVRYQRSKDLSRPVRVFSNDTFWSSLEDAEMTIRPLGNASYILQRDENTLADVVLSFRNILDGFMAGSHSQELVRLVEQRWEGCEQPLFMLALYLHPGHIEVADALPWTPISSVSAASNFAVLYFKRFFPDRDPGRLRDDMSRWCSRELYDKDDEQFSLNDFGGDIARYWTYARDLSAGPNLPDLAIAVLAITANTATCERYFSEVARIHTPTRNRLKPDKADKSAVIRQAVRDRYREHEENTDKEITEEDSDGNKYVRRIIKPDERPFRPDSSTFSIAMNPLSPRNSTPRQLFFSANSPTGTQRHPRPTPDRLQTLSHPSTPVYSSATSTHPRATALPVNLSNPATFTVNHEEFESFDPTRTLDFSSVTSPQTSVALLSGNDSIGSGESTHFNRQHFVGSPHTTGPLNNALANDDILAHWRWLLDGIPNDDDVDIESGTSENENVEHIRHQNAGIDDHEDIEMELPVIEMDAAEDASRLRSRPIPQLNDRHFPQEKTLPGLRGKKVTLKELFYLPQCSYHEGRNLSIRRSKCSYHPSTAVVDTCSGSPLSQT